MSKKLIRGGTVVTAEGENRADVLISGEKVAAIPRRRASELPGEEPEEGHLMHIK